MGRSDIKEYCVYCHTTPSNRRYVGISSDPVKRWNHGKGYKKNYLFNRAIEKYGWENIQHEILYDSLTLEEAKRIERSLIKEWKLTDARFGLNLSGGGELLSEYSRKLMSESRKGNTNSKGNVLSQETKKAISISLTKYYKTHTPTFKGRHHTEETKAKLRGRILSDETKKKMRENHANVSGVNNPSAKAIAQYTTDGVLIKVYPYAKLACNEYGLDLSSVIKCCKGKHKTCGGYVWKYWSEVDALRN